MKTTIEELIEPGDLMEPEKTEKALTRIARILANKILNPAKQLKGWRHRQDLEARRAAEGRAA